MNRRPGIQRLPALEGVKLSRTVAVPGMNAEYEAFGTLIESFGDPGDIRCLRRGRQADRGRRLTVHPRVTGRSDPSTIGLDDTLNIYRT